MASAERPLPEQPPSGPPTPPAAPQRPPKAQKKPPPPPRASKPRRKPSHPRRDAKTGRIPALTLEVQKAITDAIAATDLPFEDACRLAHVSPKTALEWMQRGRGENPKGRGFHPRYAEFADAVARARASFMGRGLALMMQSANGGYEVSRETITRPDGTKIERVRKQPPDWRAAESIIERRRPEEFGRRVIIKNEGGTGTVDWAGMVQDAWAMIRAEQAKRVGPGVPAALPAPAGAVNDSRRNGEPP